MKQGILIMTPLILGLLILLGFSMGWLKAMGVVSVSVILTGLIVWWVKYCVERY